MAEEFVDALLEFFEAAVHTVLKSRNVYSPQLFENRRLYGISITKCRHPDVCTYISSVLINLKPLLIKDTLQELVIVFSSKAGVLVSKVSFIVQGLNCQAQPLDWSTLEHSFRSTLLKLHFSDNLLQPLPEGSTFELIAIATSRAGVNRQVFAEELINTVCLQEPATGFPLNACSLPGVLSMQVVLEEGAAHPAIAASALGTAGSTPQASELEQLTAGEAAAGAQSLGVGPSQRQQLVQQQQQPDQLLTSP